MKKYDTYNHAKTRLRYHMIFSTKYRRGCLDGIKDELINSLRYVESVSNFKIEYIGIDNDHIHLLIRTCPSITISSIVRRIKQITTRQMWDKRGDYLSKYYWSKRKGKLWTNGYFCCTVGDVSSTIIEEYIKNQG